PGVLFYRAMKSHWTRAAAPPLRILGPPSDLEVIVERSLAFLQAERFPGVEAPLELLPLPPGQAFETEAFRLETAPSIHGVEGMVGRFTDRATGVAIAFSGDTAPNPALVPLARGADLLIHEASLPPEAEDRRATDHSRSVD